MRSRISGLVRRVVPVSVRRAMRAKRTAIRPTTMTSGVGRGLRFDPGPSNAEYGRGDNEPPVQEALARLVRPGDVVYDVGANVGFFSILSAKLTGPSGKVIAFEPVRANAALVRRNAKLNRFANITVLELAVSNMDGTGELVLADYSGGAALSTTTPPPDASGSIEVEVITIDRAVANGTVPPPALVKIDVEGVELAVLHGMSETMRRHQPAVICEIDDAEGSGFDRKYIACVDYVRSLGYDVTDLERSYTEGAWIVGHFVATAAARTAIGNPCPEPDDG